MKQFVCNILYSVLLCVLISANAAAQSGGEYEVIVSTKHISLLFRFDSSTVDSDFMDNARNLETLHEIMNDPGTMSDLDSIVIRAHSSPEGSPWHNMRLTERRANSLRSYIIANYPQVSETVIRAYSGEGYWERLIAAVREEPDVPGREELLTMLQNPNLSDAVKNDKMNAMLGGRTFAYLRDNYILRRLRTGLIDIEFYRTVLIPEPEPEPEAEPEPVPVPVPEPATDTPFEPEPTGETVSVYENPARAQQYKTVYPLAFRTNLLLDIVGGPNLGIEIPMGRHFSVAGDFAYAYTRINNTYALQTIQGDIEARYWFKPRRNLLTGWNLGVYGTYCSRFDIQWKNGYQGDGYWSAGLSAGYSWALSKSFNIDLSVMGGFLYSPEVRKYSKPSDGHLIWEETRYNVSRLALTQVRLNLVWLIKANKRTSK